MADEPPSLGRALRRASVDLIIGNVITQQNINTEVVTESHLATAMARPKGPPSFKKSLMSLLFLIRDDLVFMAITMVAAVLILLRNYGILDLISNSCGINRRFLGFISKKFFLY